MIVLSLVHEWHSSLFQLLMRVHCEWYVPRTYIHMHTQTYASSTVSQHSSAETKTSWAFKHSNPLKSSPGSHSQSVSNSWVATRFWCFCFWPTSCRCIYIASASWYLKLVTATRLLLVATPVLKAAMHQVSQSKVAWQQCTQCNYGARDKWGMHKPTDIEILTTKNWVHYDVY